MQPYIYVIWDTTTNIIWACKKCNLIEKCECIFFFSRKVFYALNMWKLDYSKFTGAFLKHEQKLYLKCFTLVFFSEINLISNTM